MSTGEVLTFLKELGINYSVWRLNNLVKRGILKNPPRIYRFAKYSPRCWAKDTVKKVRLFVMLDQCKKGHEAC